MNLFDEIAADMSSEVGAISSSLAIALHNTLMNEFSNLYDKESGVSSSLTKWDKLNCPKLRKTTAKVNELLAYRVRIDPSTWVCNATGTQLNKTLLTKAQRAILLEDIFFLSKQQPSLVSELHKFVKWMK